MRPHEFMSGVASAALRDATGSVPDLHWHPDMGLPDEIEVNEKTLRRLCLAMARWSIRLGEGSLASIGIWRGWAALGDRADSIVIESGRRRPLGRAPDRVPDDEDMAAIRAAAAAAGGSPPIATIADETERVAVTLTDVLPSDTRMARPWGSAFDRHRILFIRRPILTPARLERSLSLSALQSEFEPDWDRALARIVRRQEEAEPYDFVSLSAPSFGERLAEMVERIRNAPGGSQLRIVVTGAPQTLRSIPGVDSVVLADGRPERLLDAIFDLIRRPRGADAGAMEEVPAMIGRHIMVVEDVAMNRALLEAMLAPTGAALSLVADGESAIQRTRDRPPDVVLMDIQLPDMSGLEVTRRLREITPSAHVVALTAHARTSDRARYLAAGMDDYLAKPIRVDDLYATLRRALD
ncbi:MAG: response regulator [Pseudomonadota bacterium]